ncbi:HXXEE domain-containing protein [Desulfitobacterium sp. AusDCA]
MCLNSIFPHLVATIVLKRCAPGTLTGLFLNLPIGLTIIFNGFETGIQFFKLMITFAIITIITITSLRPLFKLGNKLIDTY